MYNITIKGDNLYIIDIDESFFNKNLKKVEEKGSCKFLPKAKDDNILNYINDNPCIAFGETR